MNAQQSLQMTPPESFTSPPLTPPATDEKTGTTAISRIIEEIRRRKEGHSLSTREAWLRFTLGTHQYRDLRQQLQNDTSLWHFFEHKLRYVKARIFDSMLMSMVDTITSHQSSYLSFGCLGCYTNPFYFMLLKRSCAN